MAPDSLASLQYIFYNFLVLYWRHCEPTHFTGYTGGLPILLLFMMDIGLVEHQLIAFLD